MRGGKEFANWFPDDELCLCGTLCAAAACGVPLAAAAAAGGVPLAAAAC